MIVHPYTADQPIRGLTVRQPWAFLLVTGAKRIETRSRLLGLHAGDWVAIHAGRRAPPAHDRRRLFTAADLGDHVPPSFTRSAIIGVARVRAVIRATLFDEYVLLGGKPSIDNGYVDMSVERRLGDCSQGRLLYVLEDARALYAPIPWSGRLGLWPVPRATAEWIEKELVWPTTEEAAAVYEGGQRG